MNQGFLKSPRLFALAFAALIPLLTTGQPAEDVEFTKSKHLETDQTTRLPGDPAPGSTDLIDSTQPIQLDTFSLRLKGDITVIIEWSTNQEYQNDHYLIERSADSVYWDVLGEVGGAGTSSEKMNYTFLDREPLQGRAIYRLKQISESRDYSYPAIKQAYFNLEDPGLELVSVSPNPFTDRFTIIFDNSTASKVNVNIHNEAGEALVSEQFFSQKGRNEYSFQSPTSLPDGLYVVSMVGKEQKLRTYLMIKEKGLKTESDDHTKSKD